MHARFGAAMPTMKSTMHLYPVDGAAHDVDSSDTAWSYRDAVWATVYAGVDPDPAEVDNIRRWSIDYFEALHPYLAGGAYVNMMMDEGAGPRPRQLPGQLRTSGAKPRGVRPGQHLPRQPEHPPWTSG